MTWWIYLGQDLIIQHYWNVHKFIKLKTNVVIDGFSDIFNTATK